MLDMAERKAELNDVMLEEVSLTSHNPWRDLIWLAAGKEEKGEYQGVAVAFFALFCL